MMFHRNVIFGWRNTALAACATLVASLATLTATPARAIIKGQPGGPLVGSTLMVLREGGGLCSGVVIAPDIILTAGHCAAGSKQLRIHFREANNEPVLIEVRRIAVHPQYSANAIQQRERSIDLALIQSAQPLTGFSNATLGAGPAPAAGDAVTLSGHGARSEGDARSTGLHYSAVQSVVTPYGPGRILLWSADAKGLGRVPGSGACLGDSGGPMSHANGTIIAITSWSTGQGKARCGLMTQGILLGPQRGWIDKSLSAWGSSATWSAD
jgi:secreted trypsin-like serine protease